MLDAFIIEELRRREEAENNRSERPMLELPLHDDNDYRPARKEDEQDETERGVIVIEF